jgi:hypothetical protein
MESPFFDHTINTTPINSNYDCSSWKDKMRKKEKTGEAAPTKAGTSELLVVYSSSIADDEKGQKEEPKEDTKEQNTTTTERSSHRRRSKSKATQACQDAQRIHPEPYETSGIKKRPKHVDISIYYGTIGASRSYCFIFVFTYNVYRRIALSTTRSTFSYGLQVSLTSICILR